jgi:hypothetical protein
MFWNNKRGQGSDVRVIIVVGVALFVAVVIILSIWNPFEKGGKIVNTLPQALSAKAQVCQQVVSNDAFPDKTVYCYQFTPVTIGGVDQLVNCQYIKELYPDSITLNKPVTCTPRVTANGQSLTASQMGTQECINEFRNSLVKDSTIINGVKCSLKSCHDLGGNVKTGVKEPSECAKDPANAIGISTGYSDYADGVCCLPTNA